MHNSNGYKNYIPLANPLRFAIVLERYFPLNHGNELGMLNLMRWIWHTAYR